MKIILLNGAHGSGRDEAAKAFCNLKRRGWSLLNSCLVWPFAHLGTKESFENSKGTEYVVVPDVDEPEQLIKAVELVGIQNVCLVNVFRPGFGGNVRPLGYDRKIGDGPLEHLDFNLYNDGERDLLGEALAHIVEQWEAGATFVEKHTGAS